MKGQPALMTHLRRCSVPPSTISTSANHQCQTHAAFGMIYSVPSCLHGRDRCIGDWGTSVRLAGTSCPSRERHRIGCSRSPVRTLPLPPDAFACWWRPCGVTLDAVPKQSWYQSCGKFPPSDFLRRALSPQENLGLSQ